MLLLMIKFTDHAFPSYRFNSFSLEASSTCRYDYVAVYDGENTLAPLMGKFCGQQLPPNLRSSSNQMFLEFVTDASVAAEGWRATFSETLGGVSVSTDQIGAVKFVPLLFLLEQNKECGDELYSQSDRQRSL